MKVKTFNRVITKKNAQRIKRKLRIRGKIVGEKSKPRVNFFRSNKHFLIQAIDDRNKLTLASISTYESDFKKLRPTVETAINLGKKFSARLKEKNIDEVVFDRNGYKYHGVLKAFVDQLREEGIKV